MNKGQRILEHLQRYFWSKLSLYLPRSGHGA